jgi:hypothetical protein
MVQRNATVLKDFQRTVRNEPYFYVYKIKIWVLKDTVESDDVIAWLRERYAAGRAGHRYRVCTYRNKNGERYVDYILMESCNEQDEVYIKLRWGFSQKRVARGNKVFRKKLNKDQKAHLDKMLAKTKEEFYASLG